PANCEMAEERGGGKKLLPERPASPLKLLKSRFGELCVKLLEYFGHRADLLLLDPEAILVPPYLLLERKDAVGVDKNRDSSGAEGFVKTVGKISRSANT